MHPRLGIADLQVFPGIDCGLRVSPAAFDLDAAVGIAYRFDPGGLGVAALRHRPMLTRSRDFWTSSAVLANLPRLPRFARRLSETSPYGNVRVRKRCGAETSLRASFGLGDRQ